jgi:GTP-binding protein
MRLDNVSFEASYGVYAQIPASTVPEIVFSGHSNVGKSSLINKVLNRKNLARVSGQPGKTITINFFKGDDFKLVDLPGYGYAKASQAEKDRWGQMIDEYLSDGRNIKLIVQLIDMRHAPTKDDLQMLDYLFQCNAHFVVALTKCDKLNKTDFQRCLAQRTDEIAAFGPMGIIPFSATKGTGADTIRTYMENAIK